MMALDGVLRIAIFCFILKETNFGMVATAQPLLETFDDPINYYTTVELACSEGYPIQEHKLFTADGYFLLLHRIPSGRFRPRIPQRSSHYRKAHLSHHPDFDDCLRESANLTSTGFPILLVHGILMASDGWLLQGGGRDLAYMLADAGFDVWLTNFRGNFYTRKHKTLTPSDPRFWDYSFHEHGVYDMPAMIDYVISVTKWPKVGYVGFSMGTTTFFVMASVRPEYREKILAFGALAPVAYAKYQYLDPGKRIAYNFIRDLVARADRLGTVHEVFPRLNRLVNYGRIYCSMDALLQELCYDFVNRFNGYPSRLSLTNLFQRYLSHIPSGTSLKTFKHFIKNIYGNTFKFYDYGPERNIQLYGFPIPPDYPLWNITTPVALYFTTDDLFYSVEDIHDLMRVLPNVVYVDVKTKFNHMDYVWASNAKDTLYPKIISLFKRFSNQYYLELLYRRKVPIMY